MLVSVDDFLKLRTSLPAIDVRSENEFQQGHIPGAVNIPILNNEERVQVGTDYKQRGQMEAIKTGFKLVGPRIADMVSEAEKISEGRELLVHCWRGGMRSSNFCLFVGMAKIKTHQLIGGYKFYRQKVNDAFALPFRFNVIGGYTGSGKSEVLRALRDAGEQVIDLEGLANHKGSVFGGLMMPPQPTTEQFQNDLFEVIRNLDVNRPIWIEDESITIGKVVLPDPFWKSMNKGRIIQLDVTKEERIKRLVREYGPADREQFLQSMNGIVKKLGGQHYQAAREKLLAGDMASTIDILLTYYDKAYGTGLSKKLDRVTNVIPWSGNSAKNIVDALKHIHA